jgi:hypothetical protein
VGELAVALHQPETERIARREGGHQQPLRIDQRPPDPFAGAGLDREAIGIVHLRPIIFDRRTLVLAEEIHARQRRYAELGHLFAQIQLRLHVHGRFFARPDHEAVGAGHAR